MQERERVRESERDREREIQRERDIERERESQRESQRVRGVSMENLAHSFGEMLACRWEGVKLPQSSL